MFVIVSVYVIEPLVSTDAVAVFDNVRLTTPPTAVVAEEQLVVAHPTGGGGALPPVASKDA